MADHDDRSVTEETNQTLPSGSRRGKAKVEVRVELDLDDTALFDLRGEGVKTVTVVSN